MNPVVWSCGLGLNSWAMAVGMVRYGLTYDLAMFADTGGERKKTYESLPILQDYLRANGLPPIMTVWKKNADNSRAATLEEDCLARKVLPSIAYGYKSCSDHYKIRPQRKVMENWQPAVEAWQRGEKVTMLIGFDVSEQHRMLKSYDTEKYTIRYPLVEWGCDRKDCEQMIREAGLPLPTKSACIFCPSTKKHEILALEPDELARALAIEANAELNWLPGLGVYFKWADIVEADRAQLKMFPDPPAQVCECID